MNKLFYCCTLLLSLALFGCQKEVIDDNTDNEFRPISLDTRQDACNEATKSFSFSLLKEFENGFPGGSYCFSPLSAEFALGLIAEGSKGTLGNRSLTRWG